MSTLTFTRNRAGQFDFSESTLARFNAELRPRVGDIGPVLPESLMRAASKQLVRATRDFAETRHVSFFDAANRVVREQPELFWLTRGVAVRDGDPAADVEIDE